MRRFLTGLFLGLGLVAATAGGISLAPYFTLGSTLVSLGQTVATLSGLTLASPTLSGTASGNGTIPNAMLVTPPTATGTATTGQIPGTATNDIATAGNVGELATSTCPTGNATVTITIASPAVVTYTAHGFSNTAPASDVCPIVFTNSGGALPTGITSGTTYWTVPSSYTTNTFQIATSATNAIAGTSVNTSGSQSGTQTATRGAGLSSPTGKTITARSLTAGDWDVQCLVSFVGTAAMTTVVGGVSTAENTFGALGTYFEFDVTTAAGGGQMTATTPWVPVEISSTTTQFCPGLAVFGSGSVTSNAKLVARRRR